MSTDRLLRASDRLFRLLVKLYPQDFRDDLGESLVETYRVVVGGAPPHA